MPTSMKALYSQPLRCVKSGLPEFALLLGSHTPPPPISPATQEDLGTWSYEIGMLNPPTVTPYSWRGGIRIPKDGSASRTAPPGVLLHSLSGDRHMTPK